MFQVALPRDFNGVNFTAELAEAGRGDILFYTDNDDLVVQEDENMREWILRLLGKHDPDRTPPLSADEARLLNLERWAAATDDAMNQLILDALFASLSDEDLLADLGGL